MQLTIALLNFLYALAGAVVTIGFMAIGYKVFDGLTPFNTHQSSQRGTSPSGSWWGRSLLASASRSVW